MNGKQHTVMWLGILLVTVRLFTTSQGKDIWKLLTTGPAKSSGNGSPIPPPPILPPPILPPGVSGLPFDLPPIAAV